MKSILAVLLSVFLLFGCSTSSKENKSNFNIIYDKTEISNNCNINIVISKNNSEIFNKKEDCLNNFSINNLSSSGGQSSYLNFDVFIFKNDTNTYFGKISISNNENVVFKSSDGSNQIENPRQSNIFIQRFSLKSGSTYKFVGEDIVFELTINQK